MTNKPTYESMQHQWLLRNNKLKPYNRVPQTVHLSTQLKGCYHVAKDAQQLELAFLQLEHQTVPYGNRQLLYGPAISLLHWWKRNENMSEEEPCKNVHRIFIHNSWNEKQLRQVSRIFRCGVWVHAGQRHKRMNLASVAGRGSVSVNWSTLPSPPASLAFPIFTL